MLQVTQQFLNQKIYLINGIQKLASYDFRISLVVELR